MDCGYARVSTGSQSLDAQMDALITFGCERIWSEKFGVFINADLHSSCSQSGGQCCKAPARIFS